MKQYLTIIIILLSISSCTSTFYYSQISTLSEDILQTNDGDFVAEDDSLLIAYWFNGENAPIYINVYNKSNTPLYLDWNRSSIIVGDVATKYRNKIISISDGYPRPYSSTIISINNDQLISIDNNVDLSNAISFIPPQSRKTFTTSALSNFDYGKTSSKYFKNKTMPNKNGNLARIQVLNFSKKTTPLRFRSYLTLYTTPDKEFPVEHEFYISRLIKSKELSPRNAPDDFITRGDLFYIEQENKNKGLGQAILGTTLILGTFVIDAVLSTYEDD